MNVFFFINSKQAGSLTTNCEIYYKVTKWGMERYTVRTAALHIQVQWFWQMLENVVKTCLQCLVMFNFKVIGFGNGTIR